MASQAARCWWCDDQATARRQLHQDARTGASFHRSCVQAHNQENASSGAPARPSKGSKLKPPKRAVELQTTERTSGAR